MIQVVVGVENFDQFQESQWTTTVDSAALELEQDQHPHHLDNCFAYCLEGIDVPTDYLQLDYYGADLRIYWYPDSTVALLLYLNSVIDTVPGIGYY